MMKAETVASANNLFYSGGFHRVTTFMTCLSNYYVFVS